MSLHNYQSLFRSQNEQEYDINQKGYLHVRRRIIYKKYSFYNVRNSVSVAYPCSSAFQSLHQERCNRTKTIVLLLRGRPQSVQFQSKALGRLFPLQEEMDSYMCMKSGTSAMQWQCFRNVYNYNHVHIRPLGLRDRALSHREMLSPRIEIVDPHRHCCQFRFPPTLFRRRDEMKKS